MNNLINKEQFNDLFEIVRKELNNLDPIGVVSSNSKLLDEYDTETKEIISIIKTSFNYKDFAIKICEIFNNSTDSNFKPEYFYKCAKNILSKIKTI